MTSRLREIFGWLVRDKGLYYLATATGWWQLDGIHSDDLAGIRPESAVVVRGRKEAGVRFSVEGIAAATTMASGPRPYLIANPVPHLMTASDLRMAAHGALRREGFIEVSLPAAELGRGAEALRATVAAAVAAGMPSFFAFAGVPAATPQSTPADVLIIADPGATEERMRWHAAGTITAMAAVTGDDAVVEPQQWIVWNPGAVDPQTLTCYDPPQDWSAGARALLLDRVRRSGFRLVEKDLSTGGKRWFIVGEDRAALARLLDASDALSGRFATHWCPTWMRAAPGSWLHLGGRRVAEVDRQVAVLTWDRLVTVLCRLRCAADAQPIRRLLAAATT